MRFGDEVKVNPFFDNLATIFVEDIVLRKNLLGFGRGSPLGCAWDNQVVAELWSFSLSGGWLKIVDLPPHFRLLEIVESIAALCGGIDGGEEQICLGGSWVDEVRFRVRGNESGVLPIGCFLNQDGVTFRVRFECWKEEVRPASVSVDKEISQIGGSNREAVSVFPVPSLHHLGKNSKSQAISVGGSGPPFKEIGRENNLDFGSASTMRPISLDGGLDNGPLGQVISSDVQVEIQKKVSSVDGLAAGPIGLIDKVNGVA